MLRTCSGWCQVASSGFRVVTDRDNGFEAFFEGLEDLDSIRVKVGIQGSEAAEIRAGGISMVRLGITHEFGAPRANIPQRSFLRSTGDANRAKYARLQEGIVRRLGKNPKAIDVRRELFRLGEIVRADVIKTIKARIAPPLKAATIARKKGDDIPLIETGQLINSISSVVT